MTVKAIQLGKLLIPSNLIQGPLAGYSTAPFRRLAHIYGKPGFSCTEMISAKDLVYRNPNPKRFLYKDPEEGLLCYQLACDEPDILRRAIEIISPYQPDLIDLNCGCPVKKIRQKGIGSKLLDQPEKVYKLVKSMKESTDAVVSIKIRISDQDIAIVDAAQQAKVDYIIVHGRTWQERYDVDSDLQRIRQIKDYSQVPIIANGDAACTKSVKSIFEATNCDGIMIARAGVGQPWLYEQIKTQLTDKAFDKPSLKERGQLFKTHIKGLIELDNEKLAILQSRKFAKYYAREVSDKDSFVRSFQTATDLMIINQLIDDYFR